jgi:hypothetical protein
MITVEFRMKLSNFEENRIAWRIMEMLENSGIPFKMEVK